MKIGIIQASSQAHKNKLLFETVQEYAPSTDIINFGLSPNEATTYSYIDVSLLIGLLLSSNALDFIVTGCSLGQGMMLACNSMPGVLYGYAPTPQDAYLFAQINNGNAISLPLGEGYTWQGVDNFKETVAKLFSEPFGQGYPRAEAERKLRDTALLKEIRRKSQVSTIDLLDRLDKQLIKKITDKKDVIRYILEHGGDVEIANWLKKQS